MARSVLRSGRAGSGAECVGPGPQLQRHSGSSAGGLLVTLIVVTWYSSALWYFGR
jgi:hypothetical protein